MPSSRWLTAELSFLDQTSHPEPCVCLDPTPLLLAILVPPPELDRNHRSNVLPFRYRLGSAMVFDVLASIGSGSSYTASIVVFTGATIVLLVLAAIFVFALLQEMEMEQEQEHPSLHQGKPMLIDSHLEQGLPFPHVVGDDGQHAVQFIDM